MYSNCYTTTNYKLQQKTIANSAPYLEYMKSKKTKETNNSKEKQAPHHITLAQ
jgi:hypothetical protein